MIHAAVRTGRLGDHQRVPARRILTARNTLAQLHQSMLYVPRPGAVRKVGVELRIAELAPKPRVVPKQKREQQQCQRQQRDQYMGAPAGTLVRLESFRWHARLIIHRWVARRMSGFPLSRRAHPMPERKAPSSLETALSWASWKKRRVEFRRARRDRSLRLHRLLAKLPRRLPASLGPWPGSF